MANNPTVLGEEYTFTCDVAIAHFISETISYSSRRNNGDPMSSDDPFITIDSLSLSDAGVYQCVVEIASPYITSNITLTTTEEEQLTIPLASK